ncbi:MAG: hypothetical protein JWQ71_3028 [Pedosphaera sp.]|nr:hypothetical protein [Pedosphaera sp.]
MSDEVERWQKTVQELKAAVAKSNELSQDMQKTSTEMDVELARSRKLVKKKPKLSFSKEIREPV